MRLKVYLAEIDMKAKEFGEIIEYSPGYVSMLVNERATPSKRVAKLIEKVTEGQVTRNDFKLKSQKNLAHIEQQECSQELIAN